jgi:Methyltransferase domain
MVFCPLCSSTDCIRLPVSGEYSHCAVCDLRFLHPEHRLKSDEESARYASHNNVVDDPEYQKFLQPIFTAITVKISTGARGLDFGAGPGPALAQMFMRHGFPMEIYDPYFWPDTACLNATYDFIVCTEVVEHLYNPLVEFQKLFQLLKPGAHLGLMTLLVEPETDFGNWYYRRDPTHVVFYSRKTFGWLAQHCGFTELSCISERIVTLRRPFAINKIPN